jgi:hypothetical protein
MWGKNMIDKISQDMFEEPVLITKLEDEYLNIANDDNQILDRIFSLKNQGFILTTRQSK